MNNQYLIRKNIYLTPHGVQIENAPLRLVDFSSSMSSASISQSIELKGGLYASNEAYNQKLQPFEVFELNYSTKGIEIEGVGTKFLLSELFDNISINKENTCFDIDLDWLLTQLDANGRPLSETYKKPS